MTASSSQSLLHYEQEGIFRLIEVTGPEAIRTMLFLLTETDY